MSFMASFVDEMAKIAASKCMAASPKSRIGKRPIRAAKLAKIAQPTAPLQSAGPGLSAKILPYLLANKKPIGLVLGGSLGTLGLQRGIEDIRMAEQMRSRMR